MFFNHSRLFADSDHSSKSQEFNRRDRELNFILVEAWILFMLKGNQRYSFLFFALCFFAGSAFSQRKDSLLKIINHGKGDTTEIVTLIELAREIMYVNPDTSIILANKALALSKKNEWNGGTAKCEHNLGWFNYIKRDYGNALLHDFVALSIWENDQLWKPEEERRRKAQWASTLGNTGIVYYSRADYPKALDYYFRALKMDETSGNLTGITRHLGNIGLVYYEQGNYSAALENYFKALHIEEEILKKAKLNGRIADIEKYKTGVASDLSNIGLVHMSQHDYIVAREYFGKALKTFEELADKNNIAITLGNIGLTYTDKREYRKALDCYEKSLKLREELNDRNGIAVALGNIGVCYGGMHEHEKALDCFSKALLIHAQLGDKRMKAYRLQEIGELYIRMKKYDDSKNYLDQAIVLGRELGIKDLLMAAYSDMALLDSTTGDFKNAYSHHKLFMLYKDSIADDENASRQVRLEMQYDFDKRQAADSLRNAEKEKQESLRHEAEIKQQKIYTWGGVIGFLLMIFVAAVSFRAYRTKMKSNELISQQKKLVEEKQKEVLASIEYAKRIQRALITSEKYVERSLNKLKRK